MEIADANPVLPVMQNVPRTDVERELRRRILTGCYGPGDRIPPERDLEEEFGCSRLTVAKAMAPLVNDGLIARYRGRGTFVIERKDWLGRAKRSNQVRAGRPSTRGNVVKYVSPGQPSAGRSSRDDVLAGLHSVLNEADYHVSVDFYTDLEQHVNSLLRVNDPQIAAVVLWPLPHPRTMEAVKAVRDRGVPVILVDTYMPELDCDHVVTDNIGGAATMVQHLAGLGHQRIVYLTDPVDRTSLRDRMTGFLRGMVEAGLPIDSQSVIQLESAVCGKPSEMSGVIDKALDRLLSLPNPPTALFTSHDFLALSAMPLLKARGIRVPEDLTLVGYDGIDAGEVCATPLTTIKQDFHEMARLAGRILLERFDRRAESLRYHQLVRPQLIVRSSASMPRCELLSTAVTA